MTKIFKFFLFFVFVLAFASGGYFGYYVALIGRIEYRKSADYQLELLDKRLKSLDSNIAQLETEEKAKPGTAGKTFQSKLLQEEQKKEAEPKPLSELLRKKLEKRREEKKALLAKKEALKKKKSEAEKMAKPAGSLLQSVKDAISEKADVVNTLKRKMAFWLQQKDTAIPTDLTLTVVGGELTDSQKAQLALAFRLFPSDFPKQIKLIVTYADPAMRNGMAGKGIIILKGQNEDLFFETIVHEAGHAYGLRGGGSSAAQSQFYDLQIPIPEDDPSVPYYSLSWQNNSSAFNEAFPSLYGKTDPFEDFAESFIYYIIQGKAFREEAKIDPIKAKKYEFMKRMFHGKEFTSFAEFTSTPFAIQDYPFDPSLYFLVNK